MKMQIPGTLVLGTFFSISTTRANNVTIFGVNINSLLLLELLAIFPKIEESFTEKYQKVYKFFTYLNVRGWLKGFYNFFFVLMRTPCFWANGSSQPPPCMLGNFEFHAMHIISQQFLNSYFNIMWNIFYQIILKNLFLFSFFLTFIKSN